MPHAARLVMPQSVAGLESASPTKEFGRNPQGHYISEAAMANILY